MVEELTRQKEAVERRVLLKNVRMELMAKVEQTELKLQRKLQHRFGWSSYSSVEVINMWLCRLTG